MKKGRTVQLTNGTSLKARQSLRPLNRLRATMITEMRASERRYPDVRFNGCTEYSAVPLFTAYGCIPWTGNILNIDTTLSSPVIFLRFRVNLV
ncbi:hypothetical protein [Paenibacillus chitinolyticus]